MDFKTVLITGGAYGEAKELAKLLADSGANVVVLDEDVCALEDEYANVLALKVDFRDADMLAGSVNRAAEAFGGIALAVHAKSGFEGKPIRETETWEFDDILDSTLRAAFIIARECAKTGSAVINVLHGKAASAAEAASDAGIEALSAAARLEGEDVQCAPADVQQLFEICRKKLGE